MEWTDDGIILATRRHGETSLIVELFTQGRGRHLGLVRGGRSRRQQVALQAGNGVRATWRARLEEHLGNYAIEPGRARAATLMESSQGLYGLAMAAGLVRLLPERDPHPDLYQRFDALLDVLPEGDLGAAALARFELEMLAELGFGLDLAQCAATGEGRDLVYVSPKSGRAVGREAGAPYADRLLALPAFLRGEASGPPDAAEVLDAFALTGFFLARHVYEPRRIAVPPERERFLGHLGRRAAGGR